MKTIYYHPFTKDLFLIPDSEKPGIGGFVLHALTGKQLLAKQEEVEQYRITREQGIQYQEDLAAKTTKAFKDSLAGLNTLQHLEKPVGAFRSKSERDIENMVSYLFAALGSDPSSIRGKQEAINEGLLPLYKSILNFISTSGIEQIIPGETQELLQKFLKQQSGFHSTMDTKLNDISDQLQMVMNASNMDEVLEKVFKDIYSQMSDDPVKKKKLEQFFENIAEDAYQEFEKSEAERKKGYDKSAKAAIADALKKRGIKPLSTDGD